MRCLIKFCIGIGFGEKASLKRKRGEKLLATVAPMYIPTCHYAREEHEPKIHPVICFSGDEQFVHDFKEA